MDTDTDKFLGIRQNLVGYSLLKRVYARKSTESSKKHLAPPYIMRKCAFELFCWHKIDYIHRREKNCILMMIKTIIFVKKN